ncbi:MAG: DNA polymerase, partial [Patescibacteria group bacterium]
MGSIKKLEIAKWLLDPDKEQGLADNLEFLEKRIVELGLEKVYKEIELPLIPILEEMRKIGIKADLKLLGKKSKDLAKELAELEEKIYKSAGVPFNLNSPKQLSEVLFQKLKIDARGIPKRKTGSYSTDAEALLKIKDRHPIGEALLKYREFFKIRSTYIKPLKELAAADKENRIHTEFLQTGAATGRLSSQNPNLQNVPPSVREVFIAEKGYFLAAFDYSQIELRVLASVAGDSKMIEAFESDSDIHAITASNVFNIDVKKVSKEQRHFAKT